MCSLDKTKVKTVVVWGNGDILNTAVQYILSSKADWTVVSISNILEFQELIDNLKNQPADIVIVHQGDSEVLHRLPLILLHEHTDLRVIVVSLENNVIYIYSKYCCLLQQASDLVKILEGQSILHAQA